LREQRKKTTTAENGRIIISQLVGLLAGKYDSPPTREGINSQWTEIVRTMNTRKAVTTTAQNNHEQIIQIRRCIEPNEKVKRIYEILKYKPKPYKKKKSVVHKTDFKNPYIPDNVSIRSD
jgi:hypothetical protein